MLKEFEQEAHIILQYPLHTGAKRAMYQALQEAGVESKFVVIPGAGRDFEGEDADRASAEPVALFEEHWPPNRDF